MKVTWTLMLAYILLIAGFVACGDEDTPTEASFVGEVTPIPEQATVEYQWEMTIEFQDGRHYATWYGPSTNRMFPNEGVFIFTTRNAATGKTLGKYRVNMEKRIIPITDYIPKDEGGEDAR